MKKLLHALGRGYIGRLTRNEFESQQFRRINERPIEYRFVFEQLTVLAPKKVLDIGTGTSALPSLMRNTGSVVSAIDNVRDYWPRGMQNRHFHILDQDITRPAMEGGFDLVTCVSTLEHIEQHDAAVRGMFSLVRPGGHVILTHPYNEQRYVRDVYREPGAGYGADLPYIGQVFSRAQVDGWLRANQASVVVQEYWQCFEGELWTFGAAVQPPRRVAVTERHQLTCMLLRKNA